MRRQAEHCLELPNEMEGRDLHVARELVDRQRRLTRVEQQVAGATKAAESFVPQQHDRSVAGLPGYRLWLAGLLGDWETDYHRGP